MSARSVEILGFRINSTGPDELVNEAFSWLFTARKGRYVACANPHSLTVAAADPDFRQALQQADILTPDGVGVVLAAKILSQPLRERLVGYDFFTRFSKRAAEHGGIRYFFLGASDQALERIAARMRVEFPGIEICGLFAPTFSAEFTDEENERMIAAVNAAGAHVLWVGMTAPKQEKWISRFRHRLDVPVIAAIGAVFDFYSGTQKRAPEWVQRSGFEWLYRFFREPCRLWKRNLHSAPLFLLRILREKARRLVSRTVSSPH